MSQYDAARAAGYSEHYCRQACLIEKQVKNSLISLLEQAGLTDKAIVAHIQEGMHESVKPYGKDGKEGPDWTTRHKYCETVLKLKSHLSDAKDISNAGPQVKVFVQINNKESDGTGSVLQDNGGRQDSQRIDLVAQAIKSI